MPRRIILKKGTKSSTPPVGYKSLSIGENEEISLVGSDAKTKKYKNDNESTTLISDQQNYEFGTYSIFPTDYWGNFKIGSETFHITYMKDKLSTHDYFSNTLSKLFFGIFKEDGVYLRFVDAFDPITEFGLNPLDYYSDFGQVTGIEEILTSGLNYPTANGVGTTGGSGTGLTLDLSNGLAQQLDFVGVSPSNTFPIVAYANQTISFTQASTTGAGGSLAVDVSFDSNGDITSYTITGAGGYHEVDDVITTNDPSSGSLYIRISEVNGVVNTPSVNNPGTGYKYGDIVTILGGDGQATVKLQSNNNGYEMSNFWTSIKKKVESNTTKLEFTFLPWNNDYNNMYLISNVDLNDSGEILSYSEVSSRKISSTYSSTLQALNGGMSLEVNAGNTGEISDDWWDVTKVNYVRTSLGRSNNFPRAEFADGTFLFTQQSTTGIGTNFQYTQVFDSSGNPSGNTVTLPNGQDYQANDLITVEEPGGNTIIVKVVNVGASGDVTEFSITDITLETDVYTYDFCQYDLISNEITVLISDLKDFWESNTDVPWSIEFDGTTYIPNLKGGVQAHPTRPMIVTSHLINTGYTWTTESYLIDPLATVKIRKFGDNKTTDLAINPIYTKDKIYFVNPLLW